MIEIARIPANQTRDICSVECGSQCCRTPNSTPIVRGHEMRALKTLAANRGVKARFINAERIDIPGNRFMVQPDRWRMERVNGKCPFLGDTTGLCTIYDQRPGICREFPVRPMRGCLLKPGGPEDAEV